jgi:hypothetical protein
MVSTRNTCRFQLPLNIEDTFGPSMNPIRICLCILGGLAILLAVPMLGLGVLGLLGIAADVGPAENRQIGFGFLTYGTACFFIGVLVLAGALLFPRK